MRNVGHNKDVGKGSTELKVELKHALAIGFDASAVDSLKGEATVGPLAICVCGRHGADVNTTVDRSYAHGCKACGFEQNHQATMTGVPISRKGAGGVASLSVFPKGLVVPALAGPTPSPNSFTLHT